MSMSISSPSFPNNGKIPIRHTCDGLNLSPALLWADVPKATKSLLLIVDDPDAPDPVAPKAIWTHWVLYNLPVALPGMPEDVDISDLPPPVLPGLNDWGYEGYGGPCPPIGMHRYFFRLYALDARLPDLHYPNRTTLEASMQGHVIESAELVGCYQRQY